MSRSVVPIVDALEDEYGSIHKVPETNKTLQKIRKYLNKTIVEDPEGFIGGTVNSLSKPCVLINKKTGKRLKFKAIKYVGPATGHSETWGKCIRHKESQTYRIELLPKKQKTTKTKKALSKNKSNRK